MSKQIKGGINDELAHSVTNPVITQLSDGSAVINSSNPLQIIDNSQLVPSVYDYISLSYTGSNLTTVIYKTGGAGGTTVATLTLAYTGDVLDSITKS